MRTFLNIQSFPYVDAAWRRTESRPYPM
jgi:hypothetical protein